MGIKNFIVVPCYNEGLRWNKGYWSTMLGISDVHWIFVDDGSTDKTLELIRNTAVTNNSETLSLEKNGGKAEAVRAGLIKALDDSAGAMVGFMDSDGAFSSEDLRRILEASQEFCLDQSLFDSIWASRVALAGRNIRRSKLRHYVGRVISTLLSGAARSKSKNERALPYDTQAGLKMFSASSTLREVLQSPFRTRWFFELEILIRWASQDNSEMGMRIWEVPLNNWFEVPGSKITFREYFRILGEIFYVLTHSIRSSTGRSLRENKKERRT
jgi:glycosyltransferase involved in cell wall biosynthesis